MSWSSEAVLLNEELLITLLSYLRPLDCQNLSITSHSIRNICISDIVWKHYCFDQLWQHKVHLHHLDLNVGFRSLYYRSLLFAKSNILLQSEISQYYWSFRFKEDAGETWVENCPWHHGREASIIRFDESMSIYKYSQHNTNDLNENEDVISHHVMSSNVAKLSNYNRFHLNATGVENDGMSLDPSFLNIPKVWSLQWKSRSKQSLSKLQKVLSKLISLLDVKSLKKLLIRSPSSSEYSSESGDIYKILTQVECDILNVRNMDDLVRLIVLNNSSNAGSYMISLTLIPF